MNNIENILAIVENMTLKLNEIEEICKNLQHSVKGSIDYKPIPAEEPVILENKQKLDAFSK